MSGSPEEIRLRYLYRRLIVGGGVRVPLEAARKLVGPDCAYHLYATLKAPETAGDGPAPPGDPEPGD